MDGPASGSNAQHQATVPTDIFRIVFDHFSGNHRAPDLCGGYHSLGPCHLTDRVRQEEYLMVRGAPHAESDGNRFHLLESGSMLPRCPWDPVVFQIDTLGWQRYSQAGKPMNVHLTPDLEHIVENRVKSGRYNSASDVVREALRLLEQRDELFGRSDEEVRSQIEQGWLAAGNGEFVDGDEVFERIDAELEEMERATPK
jgi:antitoxin ParD1/3/4